MFVLVLSMIASDSLSGFSYEMKHATFLLAFYYFDLVYDEKNNLFLFGKERSGVIDSELSLCGYFVIVKSEKMSAKEALDLYKGRARSSSGETRPTLATRVSESIRMSLSQEKSSLSLGMT